MKKNLPPLSEFNIIERFFNKKIPANTHLIQGIGDDAAIIAPDENTHFVFTTDTLVKDIHFDDLTPACALGHKLAAVNLSDLAAMGAIPRYALLSLTLPHPNKPWLEEFSQGLFKILSQYHVDLIGGNTTQGPLNLNLQLIGTLLPHTALYRHKAAPGDKIFISGPLGKASFALYLQKNFPNSSITETFKPFLHYPQPRIKLGQALTSLANAAIDISDGLLADLNHMCESSQCGAVLNIEKIPFFEGWEDKMTFNEAISFALSGGEDYELCFTLPPQLKPELDALSKKLNILLYEIGEITSKNDIKLLHHHQPFPHPSKTGFQHFRNPT